MWPAGVEIERIIQHLAEGVTVQDAAGTLVWANEAAARTCGAASVADLLSTPVAEIFKRFPILDEEGAPLNLEKLPGRIALQTKVPADLVIRVLPAEGGPEAWRRVTATPLLDAAGNVQLVINYWHDITELRQAIRARDDFLSIASHELRSPISSLLLLGDLILKRTRAQVPEAPAWLVERLGDLVTQFGRVAALVDNLLDVARISEGRLQLELAQVDAAAVVRAAAMRHAQDAMRAGSRLAVRADGPVMGRWDRLRIDQIVSNLIQNAIRYGAGKPIEVSLSADEREARLVVCDHGIGIAAEDQKRIFERFERAVSPYMGGGFGLGLWIVRQIVVALGGSIGVKSLPGEGSTFSVVLPRSGP